MDKLLAVTLRSLMSRQNWNKYRPILADDAFPNSTAATIYEILTELHAANKRNVTETTLRIAIEASVSGDRATELHQAVDALMELEKEDVANADYAIRQYAARNLAYRASRLFAAHGDDATFDYAVPADLMARAARIAHGELQERMEIGKAGLPGDHDMVRHVVPLGLHPGLDVELMGGVGRGELLIVLAPPERGKTSYLWRCATNAVLGKERVVAYTLEIAKYKCALRYYQCLTGMTISEMVNHRQLVSLRRAQASKVGKLWINDFKGQSFTPSMLEADLEQMFDCGLNPSYVMIDYLELMSPTHGFGKRGRDSGSLGDVAKEVRQIAGQFNVPIVSAWQINRPGADKIVYSSTDVSESWEVIKIADIILGLNQGPLEAANNVMRLKVMKQREDTSRGLYILHSDLRRMIIKQLEGSDDNGYTRQEI